MNNYWKKVKLFELCKIKGGKRLPFGKSLSNKVTSHPYIRVRDLTNIRTLNITSEFGYIDNETYNQISRYIVNTDDVIISIVGTVGLVSIIGSTLNNANLTENCAKLVNLKNIDNNFLYYYLVSSFGQDEIKKNSVGAVQQKLPIYGIENIDIFLPPLEIQKKIAKVLSTFDDKIELNNKINENLEQQARTIFNKYFPCINIGNSFIGNYIKVKRGKNLLSKDAVLGKVPVVAGGLQPATYHNVSNTCAPVITISASGANAGFINLWHIPIWSSDSSFIDNSVSENICFWFVLLKNRQQEIYDSQTGSAQPHIYPQHIEKLPIGDIDKKLVTKYNKIVSPLFNLIGENKIENELLANLRDTLLPKLMNGEINVENIK